MKRLLCIVFGHKSQYKTERVVYSNLGKRAEISKICSFCGGKDKWL